MTRYNKTVWWLLVSVFTVYFIVVLEADALSSKHPSLWEPILAGALMVVFVHLLIRAVRSIAQLLHEDRLKRERDAEIARMVADFHKHL